MVRSMGRYILSDLVPKEKFITAFSMLCFGQGLAGLFGAPIGGLLRDMTGDYSLMFIASGSCTALAGLFVVLMSIADWCSQKRRYPVTTRRRPDKRMLYRKQHSAV
ncbi:monocarboxylate transporter 2-like [Tubulanus polymorphus]|uniref:monocarboxylate transporter 2-like n=1 Tax=Tubulanus polymorphus TaxID=672921 RepID=UPI003DA3BEDD